MLYLILYHADNFPKCYILSVLTRIYYYYYYYIFQFLFCKSCFPLLLQVRPCFS